MYQNPAASTQQTPSLSYPLNDRQTCAFTTKIQKRKHREPIAAEVYSRIWAVACPPIAASNISSILQLKYRSILAFPSKCIAARSPSPKNRHKKCKQYSQNESKFKNWEEAYLKER